jgi:hypothetical protein
MTLHYEATKGERRKGLSDVGGEYQNRTGPPITYNHRPLTEPMYNICPFFFFCRHEFLFVIMERPLVIESTKIGPGDARKKFIACP